MTKVALDWYDLRNNGMPAFERALLVVMNAVNGLESQPAIGTHLVEQRLAALEQTTAAELAQLRQGLAELQGRVSQVERALAEQALTERALLDAVLRIDADPRIGTLTGCTGDALSPNGNGRQTGARGTSMGGGDAWQK